MSETRYDVGIVGMGYVGRPLAQAFAGLGLKVLGYDIDARAWEPFDDLPKDQAAFLENVTLTTHEPGLRYCRAICVCVPTPLKEVNGDTEPDLVPVMEAAATVGRNLTEGTLVVLESTSYPGTTEGVFRELLEKNSTLKAGDGFLLAMSPERINPGDAKWGLFNVPKIVGGFDAASLEAVKVLYEKIGRVVPVSNCRTAEAAKLLENCYRLVNISFINEFKTACLKLKVDPWEAIEAAATKPFGFQKFLPGAGAGGHCIPVDPVYLLKVLGYSYHGERDTFMRVLQSAVQGNHVARLNLVNACRGVLRPEQSNQRKSILIIGVSYKPGIRDRRESAASEVIESLQDDFNTAMYDPVCGFPMQNPPFPFDAAIICCPQVGVDWAAVARWCPVVIDPFNVMKQHGIVSTESCKIVIV